MSGVHRTSARGRGARGRHDEGERAGRGRAPDRPPRRAAGSRTARPSCTSRGRRPTTCGSAASRRTRASSSTSTGSSGGEGRRREDRGGRLPRSSASRSSLPSFARTGERSRRRSTATLPDLLETRHIRGDLHLHSNWSDGASSIKDIVRAARARGYAYAAVTDHTRSLGIAHGLSVERLEKQLEEIAAINRRLKGFTRALRGGGGHPRGRAARPSRRDPRPPGRGHRVHPQRIRAAEDTHHGEDRLCHREPPRGHHRSSDRHGSWVPRVRTPWTSTG